MNRVKHVDVSPANKDHTLVMCDAMHALFTGPALDTVPPPAPRPVTTGKRPLFGVAAALILSACGGAPVTTPDDGGEADRAQECVDHCDARHPALLGPKASAECRASCKR